MSLRRLGSSTEATARGHAVTLTQSQSLRLSDTRSRRLHAAAQPLSPESRSLPRVPATVPRLRACGGSRRRTRHPVTRRHRVITPPRRPYAGALTLPPSRESRPAVPRGHVVSGRRGAVGPAWARPGPAPVWQGVSGRGGFPPTPR